MDELHKGLFVRAARGGLEARRRAGHRRRPAGPLLRALRRPRGQRRPPHVLPRHRRKPRLTTPVRADATVAIPSNDAMVLPHGERAWPGPPGEDGRTRRRRAGTAAARGYPPRGGMWDRISPALHAHGLRTFAPDLRGYSPATRSSVWTNSGWAISWPTGGAARRPGTAPGRRWAMTGVRWSAGTCPPPAPTACGPSPRSPSRILTRWDGPATPRGATRSSGRPTCCSSPPRARRSGRCWATTPKACGASSTRCRGRSRSPMWSLYWRRGR